MKGWILGVNGAARQESATPKRCDPTASRGARGRTECLISTVESAHKEFAQPSEQVGIGRNRLDSQLDLVCLAHSSHSSKKSQPATASS